jgi:putative DNA primase/helicase
MNGNAALTNLQLIGPDGQKRFLAGGRIDGCFFNLKGDPELTVICEGVATGFKIWEATGLSVVVAFNAGNLLQVARDFRRNRPLSTLLIAGDDDHYPSPKWLAAQDEREKQGKSRQEWVNAGRVKANEAAEKVGCRVILPVFADGPDRSRTDFDDLFRIEGRQAVAGQVIGALRSVEAEECAPGEQIADVPVDRLQDESWRQSIPTTSNGSYDGNNIEGVAIMIGNHRLLKDRLRYNAWTKEMELDGNPLEGHHVGAFRRVMHFERLKARKPDVQDEMEGEARRHSYDPLTDYLGGLKWDKRPRLDTWTSVYLGTEHTAYTKAVGRKFLVGAVARGLSPGCKNDNMLVLEGPQGIGKSTAVRYLFGDRFFTDNLPDFHSKDSFQQLQGAWCIEVAELSALSKAEVKDVKQFLSRLVDKFRAPYERVPLSIPRRTVFVGTVNPEDVGYLRDPTGNRRFWPIECAPDADLGVMPLRRILADRDQIWAEAVEAYRAGEEWHLEDDDAAIARAEQDKRREQHPWEPVIAAWAKQEAVWETSIAEVLTGAIKLTPDKMTSQAQRGAGAALRGLGWTPEGTKRLTPGSPPVKTFRRPEEYGSDGLPL